MRAARAHLGVVAVAAAALVAGCGGGSDKPKPLSHAQLTAQANAACASASKRVRALAAPTALAGLQDYATSVQSIGNDLDGALDKLTPSTADATKVNQYRAALRQANDDAGQLATAAGKQDRN